MPYKDVTYENGFTERFYYGETPYEEALRISSTNSVSKFPSVNSKRADRGSISDINNVKDIGSTANGIISSCT